jgi:hypothetical protein
MRAVFPRPDFTPCPECGKPGTCRDLHFCCKPKDDMASKITKSAKGEECLVRIPGCSSDPAMTIWSHFRGLAGGKGMGIKSVDAAGAYACTYCDGVYDGQIKRPEGMTKEDVDLSWFMGHIRSLVKLVAKGLL